MRLSTKPGAVHWIALGVCLLLIGFGFVRLSFPDLLDHPVRFFKGAHYTVYRDPMRPWTVAFPNSWYAEAYLEHFHPLGGRSGVTISNVRNLRTPDELPARSVTIDIGFAAGMHFVLYCRTDTKLPLNLKNSYQRRGPVLLDDAGRAMKQLHKSFSLGGLPLHSVRVLVGSQASAADIEVMESIVGSINYIPTADAAYGQADCSEGIPRI